MNYRLEKLFSLLDNCENFADVGCDHGYIAQAALSRGLCSHAYVTDISAPSLQKAVELLEDDFKGKFTPILCDGLEKVPFSDQVLIAGMGGEEIIKILQKSPYKPIKALFQPMKNADKLRKYLHLEGYGIVRDFMFFDGGKYYEVVKAVLGVKDNYTEEEELYGRENLLGNEDFQLYLKSTVALLEETLKEPSLKENSKKKLEDRLITLRGIMR